MLTLAMILDTVLKVSVLLAVAGIATALMQKQSAAARHAVWCISVVAALAIPLMEGLLPSWRAEIFDLPSSNTLIVSAPITETVKSESSEPRSQVVGAPVSSELVHNESAVAPLPVEMNNPGSAAPERNAADLNPSNFTPEQILLVLWAFGFLAAITPFVVGMTRVKRFSGRANSGLSPLWKNTLAGLPTEVMPARTVRYLESDETSMPLACGIFSPIVIVPGNAERWPAWKRRNILIHELAHVSRFDCLTQALATLLCSLYWFNPLTWIATSRMRIERELACDDCVLAAGSQAVDYADHLLEVARSLRPAPGTAMAAIAMARTSCLSTRLMAVLDSKRSRRGVSRRGAGVLAVVALTLMLPLAAFKPWKSVTGTDASPTARPALSANHAAEYKEAATISGIDLGAAPVVAGILEGLPSSSALKSLTASVIGPLTLSTPASLAVCKDAKSSSTHISQNDDGIQRLILKYSSGDDCSLEIVADGKFTFADDLSDVATLAPGATMTIKENNSGTIRKLEITSVGGTTKRQFSINGVVAPFGDAERTWLADILLAVERRTAFGAKTRVRRLFERGGVNGVLAEVSQMGSAYPKRVYLETLLDIGTPFDGPTLTRIIRIVGNEFDSDYERRLILARMPGQGSMDEDSWNAFADAVARMGSDYEKRMVLTQAFSKRQPSAAVAARLLNSVASMKSSYEIRQVLTGPALAFASNSASRPAYIAAVRRISSDYEMRQVLIALIDQSTATPGAIADLLQPASTIGSDYERGQVIAAFAQRGGLSSEAVGTLVRLVGGMKSDYEKHRALSSLISSNPRLDSRQLPDLLSVARSIDSDYELSTLLREVIARFPWKEIPRDAFERALQTISSDSDQNSVRAALQRSETR